MGKGYTHKIKRNSQFSERYVVADNGCWEWQGSLNRGGYGSTWVNGKSTLAHRYSYEMANGPIPNGLSVCHRCDNRKCVNPDHLFLGTYHDNVTDMCAKGRNKSHKGAQNGRALLTLDQVMAIRSRYANGGVTYDDLAFEYGVGRSTIGSILSNKNWRDNGYEQVKRAYVISSNSKVTPDIVNEIRRRINIGTSQAALAREYSVSRATICRIANGKAWKEVPRG